MKLLPRASALAVALGLTMLFPVASEAAINARIVNTDGIGVASRSTPSLSAAKSYGAPEGAVVTIECHAWGDPVGPRANRLWDRVVYAGRRFYVADVYTDSPTVANKPVPGVPMCDQATPAPAAPTINDAVARWAQAHVGQVYASSADHQMLARYGNDGAWQPGPYGEWSGDCLRFASAAWNSAGVSPLRAGTAKAAADAYQRAGRLRGGTPPRGALVFYAWGSAGHVGISLGSDQVVSTSGVDGNRSAVRQHATGGIGLAYRGWVDPR